MKIDDTKSSRETPRPVEPFDSTRLGRAYRHVAGKSGNRYVAAARSKRTWYQYDSAVGLFEKWCAERGLVAMPAAPETLVAYVVDLADSGKRFCTIMGYLQAISSQHADQGLAIDRRALATTLKGIRREAERYRQAAPLVVDELREMLRLLDPKRSRDLRDGAILVLGFAGGLRQSEVAGLDWMKRMSGPDRGTGTLKITDRGIEIILHVSKTKQMEDVTVPVPDTDAGLVRTWVTRWANAAALEEGTPAFRRIGKGDRVRDERIGIDAVAPVIRRRVTDLMLARGAELGDAYVKARAYTGHSLRRGLGTSMARAGVQEAKLRQRMRHKSPLMSARYVEATEAWTDSGLQGLGLGNDAR